MVVVILTDGVVDDPVSERTAPSLHFYHSNTTVTLFIFGSRLGVYAESGPIQVALNSLGACMAAECAARNPNHNIQKLAHAWRGTNGNELGKY